MLVIIKKVGDVMGAEIDGTPQEIAELWLRLQIPEIKSEPTCSNPIGKRIKEEMKKVPTRKKASRKARREFMPGARER